MKHGKVTWKRMLAFALALLMAASAGATAAQALGTLPGGDAQQHTVSDYATKYASADYRNASNYQMGAYSLPMDGTGGNPDICVPGLSQADNMVPQGLTYWAAKGWILISAYSNGQGETSRIYALSMETGNLVAQFNLESSSGSAITDHVSGIAASKNNLYVASHGSTMSYIPLSELNVAGGTVKTVRFADEVNLSGELNGANTSYASYGDGILWTGNFYIPGDSTYGTKANASSGSMMIGYNIAGHNSASAEWTAFKALQGNPSYCIPLDPNNAATSSTDNTNNNCIIKVQCATVKNGYCYVGTSYGRTNKSRIHIYRVDLNSSSGTISVNGVSKPKILMTSLQNMTHLPMTEGLFVHNGYLYNIFESACWQYNGQGNLSTHPTDVLWRFDVTTLLGIDRENDDAGIISKPASTTMGDLTFVVPEAIYLKATANTYQAATAPAFQYYVNNTSTGATTAVRNETTGKIYFTYGSASGNATLSWSFYSNDLNTKLSGGSVTLSSTSISSGGSVNITAGSSPSLAANVRDCYIQWKLSYTDGADSRAKAAYAYTYVYKPYLSPVFAAGRVQNKAGDDNWLMGYNWISGIHGISTEGGYYVTDYALPLVSITDSNGVTGPTDGWVINSQQLSMPAGGGWYTAENSGGNWLGGGDYRVEVWERSAIGFLYVDTSRYNNLNQVPNLTTGLHITDAHDTSNVYAYLTDFTGYNNPDPFNLSGSGESKSAKNDETGKYYGVPGGTVLAGGTGTSYRVSGSNTQTLWRDILWNRSISEGTIHGAIKAGFLGRQSTDSSMVNLWSLVDITGYNKSALRTAVQNATKKMAAFGVNDVNNGHLLSWYFDATNSYKWIAFQDAYKAAVIALTKLDSTANFGTLATNLTNAMNALCTKVSFDANGGTFASGAGDDCYPTIGQNPSVSFTIPSGYTATRSGYTFGGWSLNSTALSDGVAPGSSITVGYNNTLYAVWLPHYTVSFDGNGATGGSTADQAFVYGTAQNLNANGFSKTATVTYNANGGTVTTSAANTTATFGFNGWLGSARLINDPTEYSYNNTAGSSYHDLKQWTITSPFAAGEVYHLEFDAKGTGNVTNYFYGQYANGQPAYWPVDTGVGSTGVTSAASDGNMTQALTSTYQHYTVTWTLASSGNANVDKYVLFRALSGSSLTFKNVVFWKETGSVAYSNQQSVNNLCNVSGAVYQMRAQWTPGTVTLPTGTKPNYALAGWYTDAAFTTLAGVAGATYTVQENTTLYAKWERPAKDDSYVIDFGLPIQLNVVSNDLSGVTLASVTGGTGFTTSVSGGKVLFTPTAALNAPVTFTYTVTYNGADYTASVTVIPANNVYYEESFFTFVDGNNTQSKLDASWTTVSDEEDYSALVQNGLRPGDPNSPVYGFDSAYNSESETIYSLGTAQYVEVSADHKGGATAAFTFSGTGFDFYSVTDNESGLAFVDIYKIENGVETEYESTLINTYFGYRYGQLYLKNDVVTLDSTGTPIYLAPAGQTDGTFFVNGETRGWTSKSYYDTDGKTVIAGELSGATPAYAYGWVAGSNEVDGVYQVPVISRTGLPYGTYKVVIEPRWSARQNLTGGSSYRFYVDAVRVYNPIDPSTITSGTAAYDAYIADSEYGATWQSVRDLLITANSFGNTDGHGTAGVAFLEPGTEVTVANYKNVGPKNEVYLEPGQAIAFNLTTAAQTTPAKLSVGLKMAKGTTGSITVYSKDTTGVPITVNGATELYRDITAAVAWQATTGSACTTSAPIIIANTSASNSGAVISITNLKWSYNTEVTPVNRMLSFSFAPQDLVTASAVMRQAAADTVAPDASGVQLQWNARMIRRGGVATLAITAPATFEKAYVNGAEVAGYTENADGTRTWRYDFTSARAGKHAFDVRLADANGYMTKTLSAGEVEVVESTNGQGTLTLQALLARIFNSFFEALRNLFRR
ncbi:MAG: InlB B-repeat-containing protein [Clostridia bacterium]|nr:InlB B-repeat-containing protein [Clostridia bacterium]